MKKLTASALILSAILTSSLLATVYENGDTGTTEKWDIYDANPAGATVSNIFDEDKQSNVIEFNGDGQNNGYMIGHYYNENAWKDTDNSILRWSMNYDEKFELRVKLDTTNGSRYIVYSPYNTSTGLSGVKIYQGLGVTAKNGKWQTFTRDLQADLQEYDSNSSILAVNAFLVRGSGRIDDIELLNTMPDPEPVPEYIIYEDGESNTTNKWDIYDSNPAGATVSTAYDEDRQSSVMVFNGSQRDNGYRLGHNSINSAKTWNNTDHKNIRWSMNYNERYSIFVSLQTTKGHRYVYYTEKDTDSGLSSSGTYIHQGLGASTIDGTWQTFTRDLEADLKEYEPDNSITTVNGFLVRGSGMIDDIALLKDVNTTLASDNNAPIAVAGENQTIPFGSTVSLDANLSTTDSLDGNLTSDDGVSFSWDDNGTVLSTDINFIKNDFSLGTHIITLTVTDDKGLSGTDEVVVDVVKGETRVNTYTDYHQVNPSITELNDEGYVVSWDSYGQDGSGYGIYLQRYDLNGNKVGSETQVNTYTNSSQYNSSITGLNDGGYVVSWDSYGQDGSASGVFLQRYDVNGSQVGSETQVNTYTDNSQYISSITGLRNGGYVVSWDSYGQDGSYYGVYLQPFDVNGSKVGSEIQVNSYTDGYQGNSSIAELYYDIDDEYVRQFDGYFVVWESEGQDGSGRGVYLQHYDVNWNKVTSETQVNSYTDGDQSNPSVSVGKWLDYAISWESKAENSSTTGIYVANGDITFNSSSSGLLLSEDTSYDKSFSSVAKINSNSVVAWQSSGEDGSKGGIYSRTIDGNNIKVPGNTQMNTYTIANQINPSVSGNGRNNVIVWQSDGQDGSGYGIYLQRRNSAGNPIF